MVPSSVAKMNRAGLPFGRTKSALPLKTVPVGVASVPEGAFFGGGIVTVPVPLIGTIAPAPVYSVEKPVPLSETHHGLVLLRLSPQGFFRFGSTTAAP